MHNPALLPNLTQDNHTEDSPSTTSYNCHAWAVGFNDRWFDDQNYWPDPVPRGKSLRHYRRAYESIGFRVCGGWNVEEGFEKIAIYERQGEVTHTARLLDSGMWTSKMGKREDITHARDALDGPCYGQITLIMRRQIQNT
jgi:hypothetical protein